MRRWFCATLALLATTAVALAEELNVTIQKVEGHTITVLELGGGRGGFRGRGRGRGRGFSKTMVIPTEVKITSASRERRTGKLRIGVELAGGLKNHVFQNLRYGLPARIVTTERGIQEINVFLEAYDINQSATDQHTGQTVIAVRPTRPPMKR